jgi:hypothetical protein
MRVQVFEEVELMCRSSAVWAPGGNIAPSYVFLAYYAYSEALFSGSHARHCRDHDLANEGNEFSGSNARTCSTPKRGLNVVYCDGSIRVAI